MIGTFLVLTSQKAPVWPWLCLETNLPIFERLDILSGMVSYFFFCSIKFKKRKPLCFKGVTVRQHSVSASSTPQQEILLFFSASLILVQCCFVSSCSQCFGTFTEWSITLNINYFVIICRLNAQFFLWWKIKIWYSACSRIQNDSKSQPLLCSSFLNVASLLFPTTKAEQQNDHSCWRSCLIQHL